MACERRSRCRVNSRLEATENPSEVLVASYTNRFGEKLVGGV